jgi:5-methylcytosine-specific restriction protein A
MPTRPKRPCRRPGCPELVDQGYCEQHADHDRAADRYRGTAASRGYDHKWRVFRESYLRKHPLCVDCLSAEPQRINVATEVHHKLKLAEHPELKYDENNLMALCKPDHQVRTARGE